MWPSAGATPQAYTLSLYRSPPYKGLLLSSCNLGDTVVLVFAVFHLCLVQQLVVISDILGSKKPAFLQPVETIQYLGKWREEERWPDQAAGSFVYASLLPSASLLDNPSLPPWPHNSVEGGWRLGFGCQEVPGCKYILYLSHPHQQRDTHTHRRGCMYLSLYNIGESFPVKCCCWC